MVTYFVDLPLVDGDGNIVVVAVVVVVDVLCVMDNNYYQ